jgi:hypothetical protein
MVVISDKKIGVSSNGTTIDYYNADVISAQDYSTYGAAQPGRTYNNTAMKHGMNGQQKDKDIQSGGDHYTAEYWEYDARIGRRWNLDPKPNTSVSSYSCFMGNPILFSDKMGDTPRVEMNHAFYSLVRGKDNNLQYVDSKGAAYTGTLSTNATNVQSAFTTALASGSPNLIGRANTALNSKFDLFITETQSSVLPSSQITFDGDALYAYKLSNGKVVPALSSERQPSNAVAAYINLTGASGLIPEGTAGFDIRKNGSGSQSGTRPSPAILTVAHEIFGHGWQAINGMLGPDRVLNWKGGTLLGAPKKAEADAVTIQNMFALHSGYTNSIQRYYPESSISPRDGNAYLKLHEIPWGFLLGTLNGALQNYPEPKR